MTVDQVIALVQLGLMVVAFAWPIVFARRGVLSPPRWLILALGFFVVAAFASMIGYQAHLTTFLPDSPDHLRRSRMLRDIFTQGGIHVGISSVGCIFAAAFHRKPAPKRKYAHSSFLLDDRKW